MHTLRSTRWVSACMLRAAARSHRAHEVAASRSPRQSWGIAKRIPFGILRQPDQMHVAHLDGAVEPFEGEIALLKSGMHKRYRIGASCARAGMRHSFRRGHQASSASLPIKQGCCGFARRQ